MYSSVSDYTRRWLSWVHGGLNGIAVSIHLESSAVFTWQFERSSCEIYTPVSAASNHTAVSPLYKWQHCIRRHWRVHRWGGRRGRIMLNNRPGCTRRLRNRPRRQRPLSQLRYWIRTLSLRHRTRRWRLLHYRHRPLTVHCMPTPHPLQHRTSHTSPSRHAAHPCKPPQPPLATHSTSTHVNVSTPPIATLTARPCAVPFRTLRQRCSSPRAHPTARYPHAPRIRIYNDCRYLNKARARKRGI